MKDLFYLAVILWGHPQREDADRRISALEADRVVT